MSANRLLHFCQLLFYQIFVYLITKINVDTFNYYDNFKYFKKYCDPNKVYVIKLVLTYYKSQKNNCGLFDYHLENW